MTLTRDDMLRELELLPLWRSRATPVLSAAAAVDSVPEPFVEPVAVEVLTNAATDAAVITHAALTATATRHEAAAFNPQDEPSVIVQAAAEPIAMPAVTADSAESPPVPTAVSADLPDTPAITTAWLLVCPTLADAAGERLMHAIIQAMQLADGRWTWMQQPVRPSATQSQYVVLLGVEAANEFLGTTHTDVAALRGHVGHAGETRYIVTHALSAMLMQPLLKREVWQDLCLLMAEKN